MSVVSINGLERGSQGHPIVLPWLGGVEVVQRTQLLPPPPGTTL